MEERTLLTGQTFYVDDSYTITNDIGPAGLSAGDTVTWSPGNPNQVTGLTYDTNAFSDIQSAINAASDGDSIEVAAGTYTLSAQINVNKQVTILGAQANVDPTGTTTRIVGSSTESVINSGGLARAFSLQDSNITINGFDISGSTTLIGALIDSGGAAPYTNDTIQDNFVHNSSTSGGVKGIRLTAISSSLVTHNDVYTVADDGIEIGANAQGVSQNDMVSYNEVHDLGSGGTTNSALYAFAVGGPAAQTSYIGVTFQGNLVYNHFGDDAIKIGAKNGQDHAATGGSIIDNVVHDVAQDGITVNASNVNVSGNEVYNSFSTNGAIYVEHADSNITVDNNYLHNNSASQATILIGFNGQNISGVSVNHNSIVNNTNNTLFYRDNTGGTGTVDASGNYWGSSDPTTVASDVKSIAGSTPTTGRIDFTYWLNNAGTFTAGSGYQPDFSSLTVAPSTVSLQTGASGRIQEGIEAASKGGTVDVLAGNYTENVNLDNNVTVAFVGGTTVTGLIAGNTGTYQTDGIVSLGDATSSSGVSFSSNLNVDSGQLGLEDSDGAELDGQTTLVGNLNPLNGVTIGGGGSLIGSGQVGPAGTTIASGGSISPGAAGAGNLGDIILGPTTFSAGSTSTFDLPSTASYDQISADVLSLAGTLTINPGKSISVGDHFTIIDNASGSPISGTFTGLAEGAKFTTGGVQFGITYKGGDGNDVVLTALDSTPPTVTVTSPTVTAGVAYSKSGTLTLSGTVTDPAPSSGIASVTVSIDGNPPIAATFGGGTWSAPITGLADGSHNVVVTATDNDANVGTDSFSLVVDSVAPTVTVTSPTITAGVAYSKVSNPIISGTVSDGSPSSGIASVMLSIDGNAPVAATVTGGTWSYSAAGLADGNHTISVVAADNAGNQSTADNFTLKVDTVIPTVTITNPTITAGVAYSKVNNPIISGTVADASPSSGIASVMLSIDGNAPVAATVTGGTWSYSASGLADGTHTISVVATDHAGNQSTADNFQLKVDTVVPTVAVTNPTVTAGVAYSKVSNPTIAGTVADGSPSSGIASVMLSIDGNAPVAATVTGGTWSYSASGLADGNHTISVVATDNAGNQSTADNFTLKVDTVAPTLTITNPTITAGLAYSKVNNPVIAGTVSDASPSSGIASVMLSIDGNSPVAATLTGGNWSYNTSGLADGTHTIIVAATDNAGNASTPSSFTLKVDTVIPTVTVTNPTITAGVAYSNSSSLTFTGTVADAAPSSGIASVMLSIDGNSPVAATVTGGTWSYSASGLSDGSHTVSVVAKDNAGNQSTADNFTLKVDTAAPTVTVTNPTITGGVGYSKTGSPTIAGTVSDGASSSGIASVLLSIDGNSPVAATVNAGTWTYNASGLSDGNHTISVVAKDNAGNSSTATSFTLKVDTVAPTLTVTNPTITAGIAYSKTSAPTISGTVADASPSSGIASVMLTIDGNAPVAATVNAGAWTYSASGLTDGNHTISVVAKDNAGNSSATTSFTLKVDTVAPSLTVTTPAIVGGVATVNSNAPAFAGTVADASPSSGLLSVTLSIDGGPAANATISSGNWNYSGPTIANGDHSIAVTATDNAGNTTTVSFTLHVDSTLPVITNPGGPLTYNAGGSPVTLAANGTVTDPGAASFVGGKLTVSITANSAPNDQLTLVNQGLATGQIGVVGTSVYYGKTLIGSVSGGTGGSPLVVSFTSSSVTPTVAQAVVRDIQFSNTSAAPASSPRTVEFVITDGRPKSSLPADVTVNVVVPHFAPVITLNTSGFTFPKQAAPMLLAPSATVTDQSMSSFPGGALTVSFTANETAADNLMVLNQGQISVSGNNVSYGANVIGTISGGTAGTALVISLNSNASVTATQALTQAIAFQNSSSSPSTTARTVQFQLNDGGGGLSMPVSEQVKIFVSPVSIAPQSSTIAYTRGNPAVTLLPSAALTDSATTSFGGSQLVVSSNKTGDQLTIQNVGGITLIKSIVYYNGQMIGTYAGNTVSLTSTATLAAINALMQSFGFTSTGPTGAHTVTFQFTDGLGNTGSAFVTVNVS